MASLLVLAGLALPAQAQTPVRQYDVTGPVGSALDTIAGVTYLYVAEEARGNVVKIDVATGATVATFGTGTNGSQPGQFGRPYGVAVDPASHDLYVAERLNGRVQRINSSTGASVMMWGINDAAFNASGQNTNPPNPGSPQGHFQEPIGVVADAAGNVYVVDHGNNRVQKFLVRQVSGSWVAENVAMWGGSGTGNGQFDRPYGASLDSSGNLLVADGLNGRVQKFSPSGAHLATLGAKGTADGQFVIATWVGVDPAGAVYVASTNSDPQNAGAADINNQWITKFSAAGAFLSRFGGMYGSAAGQLRLPFGIVVDAAGKAYVSDYYNNRVQVFDLSGTQPPPGGGTGTDTTAPTVSGFTIAGANASAVSYQVVFSEPVSGVDAADFSLTTSGMVNASVTNVSGNGSTYTVAVSFTGTGTIQLNLAATGTGIVDAVGNVFTAAATGPTHTIGAGGGGSDPGPGPGPGNGGGTGGGSEVRIVSASGPADGTYRAGDALVFTLRFSAPVVVGSGGARATDDDDDEDAEKNDEDDDRDGVKKDDDDDEEKSKEKKKDKDKDGDKKEKKPSASPIDHDDGCSPELIWTAIPASGEAPDSGRAKYLSGSGTTELVFKYQVHGNDVAPQGIALATTLQLPSCASIRDANGNLLGATQLTIAWERNPLPGVILVRANMSNPGAEVRSGTPANAGSDENGQKKAKKARLVNLSSRLRVTAGDPNRSVAVGFVIRGSTAQPVLVRAVGPALRGFGVADALTDPTLAIRSSSGELIASNSGWNGNIAVSDAARRVGAFGLPASSGDSALVLTLPPGAYTATVEGKAGPGVALVEVYDATDASAVETPLVNISSRGYVDPDGDLIVGFVVQGTEAKRMLVRAVGPALGGFGVPSVLADPLLEIRSSSGAMVAKNNDWEVAQSVLPAHLPATAAEVVAAAKAAGAFPLAASGKDACVVVTLEPGAYSAVVTGANRTGGAVLVEVYELPNP